MRSAAGARRARYAAEWAYPGRARMFFVPERELHEGSMCAYAVPDLAPDAHVVAADGDRCARAYHPRLVSFVPAS